jgi:hypothetical protein
MRSALPLENILAWTSPPFCCWHATALEQCGPETGARAQVKSLKQNAMVFPGAGNSDAEDSDEELDLGDDSESASDLDAQDAEVGPDDKEIDDDAAAVLQVCTPALPQGLLWLQDATCLGREGVRHLWRAAPRLRRDSLGELLSTAVGNCLYAEPSSVACPKCMSATQAPMALFGDDEDGLDAEDSDASMDSGSSDDSDGSLDKQGDDFLAGEDDVVSSGEGEAADQGNERLTAFERKAKKQDRRATETRALADAEAALMLETNITDVRIPVSILYHPRQLLLLSCLACRHLRSSGCRHCWVGRRGGCE